FLLHQKDAVSSLRRHKESSHRIADHDCRRELKDGRDLSSEMVRSLNHPSLHSHQQAVELVYYPPSGGNHSGRCLFQSEFHPEASRFRLYTMACAFFQRGVHPPQLCRLRYFHRPLKVQRSSPYLLREKPAHQDSVCNQLWRQGQL